MKKRSAVKVWLRPLIEELEQRILLSADVESLLVDPALGEPEALRDPAAQVDLLQDDSAAAEVAPLARREIVFVDAGVGGHEQLVEDLRSSGAEGGELEVVLLDPRRDGVAQITETLARYHDLDAVHIVSHGSEGAVQLGSVSLSSGTLDAHADALASWGNALASDADLLFYGCDLAGGVAGAGFVDSLAELTGADVAASVDLTGSALLGGDWDLEYAAGTIDSSVAFSSELRSSWAAVLDSASFQEGVGGYASTQDTELDAAAPDADNSNVARIDVDSSPNKQALIRFEDIFGSGPNQIPLGSTINSASLTVDVTDGTVPTATVAMHRLLVAWDESATWNSMGSGIQLNDAEAGSIADSVLADQVNTGAQTFTGLEATLQAWSDGAPNHGWVIVSDNADYWKFSSSDNGTVADNPLLTVDFTPPNASPVVSLPGGPVDYSAGDPPTLIDPAATVSDPDSLDFDGGTLTVDLSMNATVLDQFNAVSYSGNDGTASWSGDWVEVGDGGSGAGGGKVQVAGGRLEFSGNDGPKSIHRESDLSAAITATLAFDIDNQLGSAGTLDVEVSDDGGASWNLLKRYTDANVGAVSESFDVTAYISSNTQIRFNLIADDGPVYFDNVQIDYSTTGMGGTINDRLAIQSTGGPNNISIVGGDVRYDFGGGPTTIGTFTGGTDGSTPLVVTLNANADQTVVQALLRAITYENVSATPSLLSRTVQFVLTDGDGGTSNIETETINFGAANAAPSLTIANPNLSYAENDPPLLIDAGLTVTDSDDTDLVGATVSITAGFASGEDELLFTDQLGITGSYDSGTGVLTLTGTSSVANYQAALRSVTYRNTSDAPDTTQRTVTVVVDDGFDTSSDARDINVAAVNDAPIATDDPSDFHTLVGSLDPTGHWTFGEPGGTNATDSGSTGNDGTYYGATPGSPGAIGGDTGVAFDGNNDYAEIAHDDSYLLDDGTVQLWFNTNDTTSGHIFSKDSMNYDTGGHLSIYLNPSGHVEVRLQSDSASYFVESTSGQPITAGQWHHVAFSFGSDGMKLYVDGALADTNAYTGGLGATSGDIGNFEPIAIGGSTQRSGNLTVTPLEDYFDGSIDEVALFDQALTAQTIQELYAAATPAYTVAEGSTLNVSAAQGVLANDFDEEGDPLTAVLVAGPSNAASFTLNPDGSFSYTPNAGFDGTDTFTYLANDGSDDSNIATATITVTGVNDAPVITSDGGGATAVINAPENQTSVTTVTYTDADVPADTITYSISGGADAAQFSIDGSGVLTFNSAPNFETPTDANTDGVYEVIVQVDDGNGGTDTQAISVSVTDLDESPVIDDASFALDENAANGTPVGTVPVVEPDANDTYTYSITDGDPGGAFAIDDSGALTVADGSQLNFEGQAIYTLTVRVLDDDGNPDLATVTVNLNDLDEVPLLADALFSVDENAANGAAVGTVPVVEPDANDTYTYSITDGDPGGAFAIDDSGSITVADGSQLNFEGQAVYTLSVEVTDDDGETDVATVVVSLNDVDEAPVIAPASFSLAENSSTGADVGTVPVLEPDANDAYTYSITEGDPGNAFAIDDSGAITVADGSQLDFEAQSAYALTVQVTDDDGNVDTTTITVDLVNVSEPLTFLEVDPDPGTDPEPGEDPQPEPEPSSEPDPEPVVAPPADVPPSGVSGSSAVPPSLATSRLGSYEVDPGTGGGAIVYEDPNVESEQDDLSDGSQITLTSGQRTLLGGERMARALDRIRMEMTESADETAGEQQVVVSAAEGAMLAVSLSWLALLLRGGSLAAVAFSTLPLWRRVDPLAVLAVSEEERVRLEEDLRRAREQEDAKEKGVGRLLDDR